MSFKAKIFGVCGILMLAAVAIAVVGLRSVENLHEAMERSFEFESKHQDVIKGLELSVTRMHSLLKEIMVNEDADRENKLKADITEVMDRQVEAVVRSYSPVASAAEVWKRIREGWQERREILERICELSFRSTGYNGRLLAVRGSTKFWANFDVAIQDVFDSALSAKTPLGDQVAFTSLEVMKSAKSLQLSEKLSSLAVERERRKKWLEVGMADLKQLQDLLGQLEKILTGPAANVEELRIYQRDFDSQAAKAVAFRGRGELELSPPTVRPARSFIHPELPEASRIYWERVRPFRSSGAAIFRKVYELVDEDTNNEAARIMWEVYEPLAIEANGWLAEVSKATEEIKYRELQNAEETYRNTYLVLMSVAAGSVILGGILALTAVLALDRSLGRVIRELSSNSEVLEGLSAAVAEASEVTSEGTIESSASLEQIRATMQEFSEKTKLNAERARQSGVLVEETRQAVDRASASMKDVISAMDSISVSGNAIGKIVKTIDEIAHQTNLLALNASVEAARAGEAGAGFAVVADEVRNLAQRSAEAAKNTASLIDATISSIVSGSGMVNATDESFRVVIDRQPVLESHIREVYENCSEQSLGIEQINKAIIEIDTVTQNNAVNIEKTASTAGRIRQESDVLLDVVRDMMQLTKGTKGSSAKLDSGGSPKVGAAAGGNGGRRIGGARAVRVSGRMFGEGLPAGEEEA
ncbi:MAG: methyl-accepting chemotaxis protein [Deltaproteobacteria bacterium]|jgi:hypothetical protein|nr:methyl-accepting chemotaxis protein [Deltaproteobacteria bacterium]